MSHHQKTSAEVDLNCSGSNILAKDLGKKPHSRRERTPKEKKNKVLCVLASWAKSLFFFESDQKQNS